MMPFGEIFAITLLVIICALAIGRIARVCWDVARDVRRGPDSRRHAAAGVEHFQRGRLDEAIRELRLAVEAFPEDLAAWVALGYAHFAREEETEGMQAIVTAARRSTQLAGWLGLELTAYGRFFQPEELGDIPSQALMDRDNRLWPDIVRGDYAWALSSLDEQHWSYTLSAPGDIFRAYCLQRLGRQVEAESALEQALSQDPDDTAVLYLAGNLYRERGEFRRAESIHRHLIDKHDTHALSHYALGQTLRAAGRMAEARRCFQDAGDRASIHPEIWLLLGEAYREMDYDQEAQQCLWECLATAGPSRSYHAVIERASRGLTGLGEEPPEWDW